jgi:hypothetical protein
MDQKNILKASTNRRQTYQELKNCLPKISFKPLRIRLSVWFRLREPLKLSLGLSFQVLPLAEVYLSKLSQYLNSSAKTCCLQRLLISLSTSFAASVSMCSSFILDQFSSATKRFCPSIMTRTTLFFRGGFA